MGSLADLTQQQWGSGGTVTQPGARTLPHRRMRGRRRKVAKPNTLANAGGLLGQVYQGGQANLAAQQEAQDAAQAAKASAAAPTPGPAPAPSTPHLSAYEKKRKGILDILNDPALASYNDAFIPNYDAARGNIENAFAQAMGEVQSRQTAGQGLLSALPGQIDANYGQAAGNVAANNAQLDQAAAATGVQSFTPTAQTVAPVTAAMQYEQQAAKTQVPTLGVGLSNLVSEQRQGLQSDRGSALADIAAQEAESRAAAEQHRQDQMNSEQEYAREQLIQAQLDAQDSNSKTGHPYGRAEINNNRGFYVANNNPEFANALRSGTGTKHANAAYKEALNEARNLISKGLGPNKLARQLNALIAKFRKKHPGMERAVSLGLFDVLGGK